MRTVLARSVGLATAIITGLVSPMYAFQGRGQSAILATSQDASGNLEVFALSARDGSVWHAWQQGQGSDWSTWHAWEVIGGIGGIGQLAVGRDAEGRLELIASKLGDGSVWHAWQLTPNGQWSSWQVMGDGRGLGPIALAANADGRLEAFALDATEGSVWHAWQLGKTSDWGSWHGWQIMGDARGLGQLAVARDVEGRLELFASDSKEGSIWHTWQTTQNGLWSSWQSMGDARGLGAVAVGTNADGRLELFAISEPTGGSVWHPWERGSVWHAWQQGKSSDWATWHDWQIMGDARGLGRLAVGSDIAGRLEVVSSDAQEGSIWGASQVSPNGGWSGLQIMDDHRGLYWPAVNQDGAGNLHAFVMDSMRSVYHAWQQGSGGGFSAWQKMGDMSFAAVWYDVQTRRRVFKPATYDLVTHNFDPDNDLALNPMLGSQTWSPSQLADASLCGGWPQVWMFPCTTQYTWLDYNLDYCRYADGPLPGHANWGHAIYEGQIYFENHSYYLQDDEYSFALFRDDFAGMTKGDVDAGLYEGLLHSEFSSDETVNYFHTWYWDALHQAVDADAGKGGVMGSWDGIHIPKPPYTQTRPLFDGKEAIVMGLYGLDCAHFCGAELHPVYAMAIHIKDDLNDDTWAVFVRNWGHEGYCSSDLEYIDPDRPWKFSFRFKRPGAIAAAIIPGDPSDPAGRASSVMYADFLSPDTWWAGPTLVPQRGAVVTFSLPPAHQLNRINGMIHLKWTVATAITTLPKSQWILRAIANAKTAPDTVEPEGQFSQAISRMTQAQRAALEEAIAPPSNRPPQVMITPRAKPEEGVHKAVAPGRVMHITDVTRQKRDSIILDHLRRISVHKE